MSDSFSKLGLGTGMLASWRGGLSPAEAKRLLDAAADNGINLIDTADSYASGECERLLGNLLRGRREKFSVMTKAGYASADIRGPLHKLNPLFKKLKHKLGPRQDFRPERIGHCLRRSLQRLQTDRVEVFVLHDPPAEVLADGALFDELSKFKASGMALRLGISSGSDDALRLALAWPDCDVIQTPLLEDGGLATPLREAGNKRPLIVLNHVSLGGRLPGPTQDASPAIRTWQEKVAALARELGVGSHAALLQMALEATGAATVLTGTRSVSHLVENCRAVLRPRQAELSNKP
jgi:pyridoxine 4-dehydrogenase